MKTHTWHNNREESWSPFHHGALNRDHRSVLEVYYDENTLPVEGRLERVNYWRKN